MIERIGATGTHGRYLAIAPATSEPAPVLVGFHGYGETAEIQLERLRAIPKSDRWLILSIEGLHHFYSRRTDEVVASWMTRRHRALAIADNIAWVRSCLDSAIAEWRALPLVVFAGFSQGVAMAFRAAANVTQAVGGVIAVGGDVPPELTAEQLRRIPRFLIARGATDQLYSEEQFTKDQVRLGTKGIQLNAGHEWTPELSDHGAEFLSTVNL